MGLIAVSQAFLPDLIAQQFDNDTNPGAAMCAAFQATDEILRKAVGQAARASGESLGKLLSFFFQNEFFGCFCDDIFGEFGEIHPENILITVGL